MQFGLLYEMQRPWDEEIDWHTLYEETLEQCELADKVGFDNLWFVEHHFLYGFSGSPCPEVMFGALSQRTKNIRIGFGVSILPNHHPVRVAERGRHGRPTHPRAGGVRYRPFQRLRAAWPRHRPQGDQGAVGRGHHHDPRKSGSRKESSPTRGNSGTSRRGGCCPDPSRSPTPACTLPAPRPKASGWPPRRASACSRRHPTPSTCWPSI